MAAAVENGGSIASDGKGENLFVEGRVVSTDGTPIPGATIETWETDADGEYPLGAKCGHAPSSNYTL